MQWMGFSYIREFVVIIFEADKVRYYSFGI